MLVDGKHFRVVVNDFTRDCLALVLDTSPTGIRAAREHGISAATFYKFKAKFGGVEASDARRLKALDDKTHG